MSKVFEGGIHVEDINELSVGNGITLATDNTSGVTVASTLNSTSATTGALVVNGGVGIASDTQTAGTLTFTNGSSTAQVILPDGSGTGTGDNANVINMNSNKIINLTDPTDNQDAATKLYVDTVAQGITPLGISVAATTGALGGSVLGNTYTFAAPISDLDGVTLSDGSQILIKDEGGASPATSLANGIYEVSGAGPYATATRVTNFEDGDSVAQITTFVSGGTNAGDTYITTNAAGSDVVGADAIGFQLLSSVTTPNLQQVLAEGNETGTATIIISDVASGIRSNAGVPLDIESGAGSTASLVSGGSTVTGDVSVASGVSTAGVSGAVSLTSGTAVGGDSGDVTLTTGTSDASSGAITLTTGAATGGSGGAITLQVGASSGANDGSDIVMTAGNAGATGNAGSVDIDAGVATDGNGGDVSINASNAAGAGDNNGGNVSINAGNGTAAGTGGSITYTTGNGVTGNGGNYSVQTGSSQADAGDIQLAGGATTGAGNGGQIQLSGGDATGTNGTGGNVLINAGSGTGTTANAGSVTVTSGSATGASDAGDITLTAGGNTTDATNGGGGDVSITAGTVNKTSGAGNAGIVTITGGSSNVSSTGGDVALVAGTVTGGTGDVTFTAHGVTIPINGSGANEDGLETSSQNIVGAINELNSAVGSVTQRVVYDLVGLEVRVSSGTFVEIAYLPWIGSLYGPAARNYTNGNLMIESVSNSGAPVLEIEVVGSVTTGPLNTTTTATLGTFEALALDDASQPGNTSERLSVRVRNTGSGVASIFGVTLEWESNTP